MPVFWKIPFQRIPAWLVLASYLFANTMASSWHDHRSCSGHCDASQHHATDCAALDCPRAGDEHCRKYESGPGACQNRESSRNNPHSHPTGQENDGGNQHDPQHCVVCDFLALAPLSAPQATLDSTAEVLPEFVVLDVLPVSGTTVETHLARGPPAM